MSQNVLSAESAYALIRAAHAALDSASDVQRLYLLDGISALAEGFEYLVYSEVSDNRRDYLVAPAVLIRDRVLELKSNWGDTSIRSLLDTEIQKLCMSLSEVGGKRMFQHEAGPLLPDP